MKTTLKFAAALSVLAAVTLPAFAQEEGTEDVTVFAPYVVKKSRAGRSREPVSVVKVSREVSFKDLDLTTSEGQATLEARVKQTASDVCSELDRRYPKAIYIAVEENKNCVKEAMSEAMNQVRSVEEAAKS